MGNTRSTVEHEVDPWWNPPPPKAPSTVQQVKEEEVKTRRQKELDQFKLDLARKHERRRQIIAEKRKEMDELREEVKRLKEENEELKKRRLTDPTNDLEDIKRKNLELKMTIAQLQKDLQDLNGEMVTFEKERQDYKAHVVALKEVIGVSKQMLMIRETQLKELREKIKEIEASLAGKELKVLSQDLRAEYEKQLQNIRDLRTYYEERQRADKKQKEEMRSLLDDVKKELQDEKKKTTELGENLERLEEENSKKYDEIKSLESTLGLTKAECRQYQAELSVINQLFSQILLGFNNNQEIDIDKLIKVLEEHHRLLQDIAINEESNQVSALPKVLLDLVNEVSDSKEEDEEETPKINPECQISNQLNSASEIVENLPKVWKVLIELLSHQQQPVEDQKIENPCYKLVETPKGPHLVLSVSRTFIRLKDLILEKKTLERETCRMKQLNTHLECRLQEQEKRLELVTNELSETWHVVGKLQKKHQLLHTQEKILRYELAQKRKLLTELKAELEYSREKWQEAREKNSNTEKQWEQLRIEFAARKNADDSHNSIESGYSDDKECSSEDEPGYETDVSEKITEDKLEEEGEMSRLEEEGEMSRLEEEGEMSRLEEEGEMSRLEEEGEMSRLDEEGEMSRQSDSGRSLDDVLAAREERLQRMESQCSTLVRQVTDTSNRSVAIENRLDELHEVYGEGRNEDESTDSRSSD